MKHVNFKSNFLSVLLIVVLFSACGENEENTELEDPTNSQTSMNLDQQINLIHQEDQKKVDVYFDGELFTAYHYTDQFKKPILYPLITANGATVTRGYPIEPRPGEREDHPHQVGIWLNYGDVNGLDFWNNSDARPAERSDEYGTIYHRSINKIESREEEGELNVSKEWVNSEGEVLLTENTTYIFRDNGDSRSIDRITNLTAAGNDVSLKDNKEGMIGIRMARELEHPDEHDDATGIYRSSEGLEGNDVWGTRAKWVNLTGQIDGTPVSVALLDHPENVGYPTYWHARGYGLFAANPLGMKEMSGGEEELNFVLSAGDSITFKHRIIINSGEEIDNSEIDTEWEDFVG